MVNFEAQRVRWAHVSLFLGTSFKRVAPLVPLDTIFRKSNRIHVLNVVEVPQFMQFYEDFKVREKINKTVNSPLNKTELLRQIQKGESLIYAIKNNDNLIEGALVMSVLRLPRDLNQQYFGADFERFAYVHKLCYQEQCQAMIPELVAHVALCLREKGLKAAMAHVRPQYRDLCENVLQKPFFKRVAGHNFMGESTLICMTLEA